MERSITGLHTRTQVREYICARTGMTPGKFNYHVRKGYFLEPKHWMVGSEEPLYSDEDVAVILERCRLRGWCRE